MKPRDVSISVYQAGPNTIRVWNASFSTGGVLKLKDGKIDENHRRQVEKAIQRALEQVQIDLSVLSQAEEPDHE